MMMEKFLIAAAFASVAIVIVVAVLILCATLVKQLLGFGIGWSTVKAREGVTGLALRFREPAVRWSRAAGRPVTQRDGKYSG